MGERMSEAEQIADRLTSDIFQELVITKGAGPHHWLAEVKDWHGTHGKAYTMYRGSGSSILEAMVDLENRVGALTDSHGRL